MDRLSPQDIKDFLHKLSTESTKVRAVSFDPLSSICVCLCGRLGIADGGRLALTPGDESDEGVLDGLMLLESTLLDAPCMFADPLLFKDGPFAAFFANEGRFDFAISFALPMGQCSF